MKKAPNAKQGSSKEARKSPAASIKPGGSQPSFEEQPNVVPLEIHDTEEPLATAFEIAQLAVAIATMKGEINPDIVGAIELMRNAALQGQHVKKPVSTPMAWKTLDYRNFPGSDQITPPKRYSKNEGASSTACWRAVLGRRANKQEIKEVINRAQEFFPIENEMLEMSVKNEDDFWKWAMFHAQFAPRFAKLYGEKLKRRPRRSKESGKFEKSVKSHETGRFKSRKKASL